MRKYHIETEYDEMMAHPRAEKLRDDQERRLNPLMRGI